MTLARLAVFDMVGTTVHAGDEVPAAFREAMGSVGVELPEEAITGIRGRSKRDAITDLLRLHLPGGTGGADLVEAVYARFQEALRSAYRARARAVPGAEGVFLQLKQLHVETVLNTGLDRETAELIVHSLGWDALGLGGLVTGDDVVRGRPAPDLIEAAMRLRTVEDPASVIAVGDTTSDLDAAAAAGVGWSIGVLSGAHTRSKLEAHPHTVILESVEAVPDWLVGAGALPPPSSRPGGGP